MRTNEVPAAPPVAPATLTGPMRRVEERLGRSLREYLIEKYASGTIDDVAASLKADAGAQVDRSTVSKWMDRLGIERRFPGQRPEAVA